MSVQDVIAGKKRWAVACGDAAEQLAKLPDGCVHCCVTSPPYYGLRDYGVDGQIGLEQTPEEFIEKLVAVFREVKRVLRDDGTCWVNMGDSYAAARGGTHQPAETLAGGRHGKTIDGERVNRGREDGYNPTRNAAAIGLKHKDLMGMPWMLAFALRADGWYLRQDIIWHKPNPMPESVQDRCTKSHEYLFLLSKKPRYYFDAEAVSEACSPNTHARISQNLAAQIGSERANGGGKTNGAMKAVVKGSTRKLAEAGSGTKNNGSYDAAMAIMPAHRNKRSVWTIPTFSYSGAHFATFPPKLVEPCIRAGTSEHGVCGECGAPFVRATEKERFATRPGSDTKVTGVAIVDGNRDPQRHVTKTVTTGWVPSCKCGDGIDRRVVLSPTGERAGDDPSKQTGRAGMNRPRGEAEGQRPMTRHEQKQYAAQLKESPNRSSMAKAAGDAFSHYIRTDDSGARPIPHALLEEWIELGWLERVEVPEPKSPGIVPAVVLDCFGGSGTTLQVAVDLGRRAIATELNPAYVKLINKRMRAVTPTLTLAAS